MIRRAIWTGGLCLIVAGTMIATYASKETPNPSKEELAEAARDFWDTLVEGPD